MSMGTKQINEQNSITKYLEKCNHDGQCIKACVQCGLVVNQCRSSMARWESRLFLT
jgi:hypothetical protein